MKNNNDWQIDGGLIYRLGNDGANSDEINVTMSRGTRDISQRYVAAGALLGLIVQTPAPLTKYEADLIMRMARELETTGRIASLEDGEAKQAAIMRNREVQCAFDDLLASLQQPRGGKL